MKPLCSLSLSFCKTNILKQLGLELTSLELLVMILIVKLILFFYVQIYAYINNASRVLCI